MMRVLAGILALVMLMSCVQDGDGVSDAADVEAEDDVASGYVFDDEETAPEQSGPEATEPEEAGPKETESDTSETPEALGQKLEMKPDTKPVVQTIPETTAPTAVSGANPEQILACQRKKGSLTKTPAGFYVCIQQTGEGRKACTASGQCKGACLARSGTCAPFTPLIGCNEVITASGGMSTVCID